MNRSVVRRSYEHLVLMGFLVALTAQFGCSPALLEQAPCASSDECGSGTCTEGVCVEATDPTEPRTTAAPTLGKGDEGQSTDICGDGLDNDADGMVDEDCLCGTSPSQTCFGGNPENAGVGACTLGAQTCSGETEFSKWSECTGYVLPTDELCDGIDNNCDGTTDEGCTCVPGAEESCYGGPAPTEGVGACQAGIQRCLDDGGPGLWGSCSGAVLPSVEVCGDGVDNDCDGEIDNGCVCRVGDAQSCFLGGDGMAGVGICTSGSQRCDALARGGSDWGTCEGATFAATEICDGLDNNCDGQVDDGCTCTPGATRACPGGTDVGICKVGTETCLSSSPSSSYWGACEGAVTPGFELCEDSLDNDCDGSVNEDCTDTDLCTELPFGETRSVRLSHTVEISTADVLLLVDATGSMGEEIANIKNNLSSVIIPGLVAAIPDVQIAVASFRDFTDGQPFVMHQTSTSSIAAAQNAVNVLSADGGGDLEEAQVEALYQIATGAGLGSTIPASPSCPAGGRGYACFRPNATPIVLLFTDAPFHNGPGGSASYAASSGRHTYNQAVSALNGIGAKVLGLFSGSGSLDSDLKSIASDTGSIDAAGSPIVINIGTYGSGLNAGVISATQTLVDEVPMDIDTIVEAVSSGALAFYDHSVAESLNPATAGINRGSWFESVAPGASATIRADFVNNTVPSTGRAREYVARVVLRGDGATRLTEQTVRLVVPGVEGATCAPHITPVLWTTVEWVH